MRVVFYSGKGGLEMFLYQFGNLEQEQLTPSYLFTPKLGDLLAVFHSKSGTKTGKTAQAKQEHTRGQKIFRYKRDSHLSQLLARVSTACLSLAYGEGNKLATKWPFSCQLNELQLLTDLAEMGRKEDVLERRELHSVSWWQREQAVRSAQLSYLSACDHLM